ncbi:MAG: transaldolase [Ilumatobacteraceae bacterium]
MDRLAELYDGYGQSPWLDNLTRGYITGGQLAGFIERGVRGMTSNPTIFAKAIQGSADYDDQFKDLANDEHPVIDDYWEMVLHDINTACDAFSGLYEESGCTDGFVSVEVDPGLANDGPGTEQAARGLHQRLGRPNAMVKIPATAAGVPIVEQMFAEGRNINITLIFSLDRYQDVMEAYLTGLERYAADGATDLSHVASVASFFVSRVDTEVDRRLEAIGSTEALALRGKAAIAQAKLAYQRFQATFSGTRWDDLAALGARVQRPLWASTSTKNPDYPDTMYVDNLIGPNTVDTLPDQTLEAFAEHGTLARTVDLDVDEAEGEWAALSHVGVDMDDVADQLEREGVDSFKKSFDELIDALTTKAAELTES